MKPISFLSATAVVACAIAEPIITVNTTTVKHLDWVRATFSGLSINDNSAWIGVFYPETANVSMISPINKEYATSPWTASYPIKWVMCNQIPGCLETGSGFFDFRLVNAFQDCKISMFTGGTGTPKVVAESPAIRFTDSHLPMKGHLTRTQSPNEMMVVWSTRDEVPDSVVRWSFTQGGPYNSVAKATTKTHTQSDLCDEPATTQGYYPPFYWHNAVISGLNPGKDVVYYVYGSEAENTWSDEHSFRAPPPPGSDVKMVLVADIGVADFEANVTSRLNMPHADQTWKALTNTATEGDYDYSLLVHVGDLAYACGYLVKWETYMAQLGVYGVANEIPYVMNQGNHERDAPNSGAGSDGFPVNDSGGECGIPTEIRFPSPTAMSTTEGGWYTLSHGSVFLVMLNSEAQVAVGSAQYTFLSNALASVDRSLTPWVIVAMHRPMYYVSKSTGHVDPTFQAPLEPLLYQYQVDVLLEGHVHNTFRSCPVYNGTCITPAYEGAYDSFVVAAVGNAGCTNLDAVSSDPAPWDVYQASEYGFAAIHATLTTMDIVYYNNASEVRHTATLHREYPRKLKK